MNSVKQYVNSEPMWGYCSRAEKKKKKKKKEAENVDVENAECKRNANTWTAFLGRNRWTKLKVQLVCARPSPAMIWSEPNTTANPKPLNNKIIPSQIHCE